MKTVKKGLALLLALLMVLSLSACGSLEAAKTVRKIQKLDSYHVDCSIDMSMSLGMMGESFMDLALSMGGDADVNRDPLKGAGEFRMELMDENVNGQFYFVKGEDGIAVYSSADSGETWKMSTIDLSASSGESGALFSKESLAWLAKTAATFEEAGEEEVNGYEATVYEGYISGEELKALLDESDAVDATAEAMELDPGELELDEISDIPITVALDNKSGLPVRVTIDLSGLMESLLPFFLQVGMKASAESGEDTSEMLALFSMMDISFDEFMITVLLSEFDEVGEVTIPEEVLEAAVETGSPATVNG
jgi:hypothetical protein